MATLDSMPGQPIMSYEKVVLLTSYSLQSGEGTMWRHFFQRLLAIGRALSNLLAPLLRVISLTASATKRRLPFLLTTGLAILYLYALLTYPYYEPHVTSVLQFLADRLPLVVLTVILIILVVLWKVPQWQTEHWRSSLEAKELSDLENKYRTTLAQILGGLAILTGLYFTWQQVNTAQQGQITDRFTKAIDEISSTGDKGPKIETRLGGIYALERISKDSERDYPQVVEVLTAYVRENSPRLEAQVTPTVPVTETEYHPRADIQAVLTVLGRRERTYLKGESTRLDLSSTNLRSAQLSGANLAWADLTRADLTRADLRGVNLRGAILAWAVLAGADLRGAGLAGAALAWADLTGADLTGADLMGANLMGANLMGVYLTEANLARANLRGVVLAGVYLTEADLTEADLTGADLMGAHLMGANLTRANLTRAYLVGAYLMGAHLMGADLRGADLRGANLSTATGLTLLQLSQTITDKETKLPDNLPAE